MTLKTLKDILSEAEEYEFVRVDNLKAEAIKWVKKDKELDELDFMNFFNITEEDLDGS